MKKLRMSLVVIALLLSGCASTEEKRIDTNTGNEQLVVAMDCGSAPYSYLVEGQNDSTVAFGKSSFASGYDVLVARDLAKALKKDLIIKKMDSSSFAQALEDDKVDLVMNGMIKDSDKSMTYSSIYYASNLAIVVRKDDPSAQYTDIKQFKKMKMVGQAGMSSDRVIAQVKGVKHQTAKKNVADMIKAVKTKKSDALVVGKHTADKIVAQNGDLSIVSLAEKKGFKAGDGVVIGFKAGSEEDKLYKDIQAFIKKMTKDANDVVMQKSLDATPAWIIQLEEQSK